MTHLAPEQHRPGPDPADLAAWGLHCYCPSARSTPHSAVAQSGRLLYAAREGAKLSDLERRGMPVSREQLDRLISLRLVEHEGDWIQTAFPVVGLTATSAIREGLHATAAAVVARITPIVRGLIGTLADQGLGDSAYAIVFGHALDGLAWDRIAVRGVLPDTALTPERPWWNGAFWAIHPEREGSAGTNLVDCGTATLTLVWTQSTVESLNRLASAPGLPAAVRGLLEGSPSDVTDLAGQTWPLRRADGYAALPVVGTGDRVDELAGEIADAVAEALVSPEAAAAVDLVGHDRATALVVVAHELIWQIADELTATGICPLPRALTTGAPSPAALTGLLFLRDHAGAEGSDTRRCPRTPKSTRRKN